MELHRTVNEAGMVLGESFGSENAVATLRNFVDVSIFV
jgi:hypothetical protein